MAKDLLEDGRGVNRCVRAREGYVVYNRHDIYIGRSIERYGEFSEIEARLLRALVPPGGVVIEVGANIGTHTLVLAHAAGPAGWVVAYEPQRAVFQILCANLALNSLARVDARQRAVGAGPGSITVPDIDYGQPGNFGGVALGGTAQGSRVRQVALDADVDLPRLDLVKVDVEGMELDVLRGADGLLRRLRPMLYVENDRVDLSRELILHLRGLDYRLYWHLPPLFNPDNFFHESEDLFPDAVSVNMLAIPRERSQHVEGLAEVADPLEHPFKHDAPRRG